MNTKQKSTAWDRRSFLKASAAGMSAFFAGPFRGLLKAQVETPSPVFWVDNIPDDPFLTIESTPTNFHLGVESLLQLMADNGLFFYRSDQVAPLCGPQGLIAADDVVLIKVNAQWKYRGATNSDVVRGLIQRILSMPGGFWGEVILYENGQGRGSLNCDGKPVRYGDDLVHANANDERHSFLYLVNHIFKDSRVTAMLGDGFRANFIDAQDHESNGFRTYENVSYPCFTSEGGHRVELREGIWTGSGYTQNLKLLNVPVLKHHDTGGSEVTASLKHYYGLVTMSDGNSGERHYSKLGETCGKMVASVRMPSLNILDAIWVSHLSLAGYPEDTTFRANQLMASQDPVALDYCGAKYILYPIDNNERHHPDFAGVNYWLGQARTTINARGGLYKPDAGVYLERAQKDEANMKIITAAALEHIQKGHARSKIRF